MTMIGLMADYFQTGMAVREEYKDVSGGYLRSQTSKVCEY
jgi:hypothetical protein